MANSSKLLKKTVPRFIANEIPAAPRTIPKRPAGMEDLEDLLNRTAIMEPDIGNVKTSTPRPPPPAANDTSENRYEPTTLQNLKRDVKWVHPDPQVRDPVDMYS